MLGVIKILLTSLFKLHLDSDTSLSTNLLTVRALKSLETIMMDGDVGEGSLW